MNTVIKNVAIGKKNPGGYVYLAKHPLSALLKVGSSAKNPKLTGKGTRLQAFNFPNETFAQPLITMEFVLPHANAWQIEKAFKQVFAPLNVKAGTSTEVFRINLDDAISALEEAGKAVCLATWRLARIERLNTSLAAELQDGQN